MPDYVPTSYFEVTFNDTSSITGLSGQFTSVSGLGIEFEYETYTEGGSNYPRHFFKSVVPQTLVLEQGTVTTTDSFSAWIAEINSGMATPLNGTITLKNHAGEAKRSWVVQEALPVKYIGPSLNSMQSELAVSRIELRHNGCM